MFRGYELNLMLRVQDRATARLRRLASDVGNVGRAADLQRKASAISVNQAKAYARQADLILKKESMLSNQGVLQMQHKAKLATMNSSLIRNQAALNRLGIGEVKLLESGEIAARNKAGQYISLNGLTERQNALLLQNQSIQLRILATEREQVASLGIINREINANVAAQAAWALEASATEKAYERAAASQALMARGRTAVHGGSVALMTGGIGLAASAASASAFANFNRESVKAATQMRGDNASFKETAEIANVLQTSLLDLTREFPASANEMAQSIYDIASGMDVQIDKTSKLTETQQRYEFSMRLLRAANKAAVAGQIDLQEATDALLVVFNNFDPQAKHTDEILNTLFSVVRYGKGTFAEFSPVFGKMAASANAAGQTLIEAGGAVAFLSQRMASQAEAATAYSRIMQIMGRKEFTKGFQNLFGVSATEQVNGIERLKQLSEIIGIIVTRAPSLTKGGTNLQNILQEITARGQDVISGKEGHVGLISTQQSRIAIGNLIRGWQNYGDILDHVRANTTEFDQAFKAMSQTPGVRFQVAVNQFKAFAIIFGEQVLPGILSVFSRVGDLIHRFEDLDPHTRKLIGQFTVWGSVLLVVGGFLSMVIGGITTLIARVGAAATSLGSLFVIARRLAAIGAIALIIKTAIEGDPEAKDFVRAALLGAAAGSRGGIFGAIAGAFVVPIALEISSNSVHSAIDSAVAQIDEKMAGLKPVEIAYAKYLHEGFRDGLQSFDEFEAEWKSRLNQFEIPPSADKVEENRQKLSALNALHQEGTKSILDQWRELAANMSGLDVMKNLTQQMVTSFATIELSIARAFATGNKALEQSSLVDKLKFLKNQIEDLEAKPRSAENVKQLTELYQAFGQTRDQYVATQKEENDVQKENISNQQKVVKWEQRLADTRRNAVREAMKKQTSDIKQYTDVLISKFKELEEANKAAFGTILQGPIMGGPLGSALKQVNDLLAGVGAKPIAIPIKLITQDLQSQLSRFNLFESLLGKLQKRGLPPEMIADLKAQGTEALPMLLGLSEGGKGALNMYKKVWEQGKKARDDATQADMNSTLKLWKSYGHNVAWNIVQGIASDKSQATLREGYRTWILGTFGDELNKGFNKSVSDAVTAWKKNNPIEEAVTPKKNKKPKAVPVPVTLNPSQKRPPKDKATPTGDQITVIAKGTTPEGVKSALNTAKFTIKYGHKTR